MTPSPGPSQPAPSKGNRSSLLFWLGCASVALILLLVAVGITMMIMLRRSTMQANSPGPGRPSLDANWRTTLRADRAVPADAARFAPARTDSGNAAVALRQVNLPMPYRVSYTRLARRMEPDSAERAQMAALLRDSTANRALAAARMDRFDIVPLILADTMNRFQLFGVSMPAFYYWDAGYRAVELLLARGVTRERAGRIEQAREDYRAALGLGLMMFAREPSVAGSGSGLRFIADASASLKAIAGRDTAAANAADRLGAWAQRVRNDQYRIMAALGRTPDSLYATVSDTTLPFPVRADAVHSTAVAWINQGMWSIFRGPKSAVLDVLRSAEHDADPDIAQLALTYDSMVVRMDRVGGFTRVGWVAHRQQR